MFVNILSTKGIRISKKVTMTEQSKKYQLYRQPSIIETYVPQKHIKRVINLSLFMSIIFLIYSMTNIGLYYFTGECIRDNVDVLISIASIVLPIGFSIYIYFVEKYYLHPDKVSPSNPIG